MKIEIKLKNKAYTVFIDELEKLNFNQKIFILTNEKIAQLHLAFLLEKIQANDLFVFKIKDGEEYKNLKSVEYILNEMFRLGLDRKSILISFGGGVISDLGGFVASIFKRGISHINIPTTLLACVDAAVGGKTGVNCSYGKNLIGSFYQPSAVYCQSDFLFTLPPRELAAGMAEVIKMAIFFDGEFLANINEQKSLINKEILQKIIYKSVQMKAKIVEKDERETGERKLLNYGHSFAHAIEKEGEYKEVLHGEAVAMGINMANKLAQNLGLVDENFVQKIQGLLQSFNLPIKYKIKNINNFYEALFMDKKNEGGKIFFILPSQDERGKIEGLIKDLDKEIIFKLLREFL